MNGYEHYLASVVRRVFESQGAGLATKEELLGPVLHFVLEVHVTGAQYRALDLAAGRKGVPSRAYTVSYSIGFMVYQMFHHRIRDKNGESVWPSRKTVRNVFSKHSIDRT